MRSTWTRMDRRPSPPSRIRRGILFPHGKPSSFLPPPLDLSSLHRKFSSWLASGGCAILLDRFYCIGREISHGCWSEFRATTCQALKIRSAACIQDRNQDALKKFIHKPRDRPVGSSNPRLARLPPPHLEQGRRFLASTHWARR